MLEEFDEDTNEIFPYHAYYKGIIGSYDVSGMLQHLHKLEDVFYFIRESHPDDVPHDELVDDVLEVSDFVTEELER